MSYLEVRNMIKFLIVFLGLIILALLFEGTRRILLARMHNRIGPPIFQPFYDLIKLFSKKTQKPKNLIFNIVPIASLICAIPILTIPFFFSFDYDFLVLGYLFILLDTFYIFGAVASRSPFAMHSSIRELFIMLGYEISLIILLSIFFFSTGTLSFAAYSTELAVLQLPLASVLLLLVGMVIVRVTPYDVVNAEPEISAGFFSEYSGKSLAILEIAEFIKNFVFYFIIALLLFGKIYALPLSLLFLLIYTLSHASSPRTSTFLTVRTFLFIALLCFIDIFLLV